MPFLYSLCKPSDQKLKARLDFPSDSCPLSGTFHELQSRKLICQNESVELIMQPLIFIHTDNQNCKLLQWCAEIK